VKRRCTVSLPRVSISISFPPLNQNETEAFLPAIFTSQGLLSTAQVKSATVFPPSFSVTLTEVVV
jgi:hypothetical protein